MIFAIRYGFRIQCGVHTTTSNHVISELSILLATTPGQNLQINTELKLLSSAKYCVIIRPDYINKNLLEREQQEFCYVLHIPFW